MKPLRSYSGLSALIESFGYEDILYSLVEATKDPSLRQGYSSMLIRVTLKDLIAELEKQNAATSRNQL